MKRILLDRYTTRRGGFEVWYDPRRDRIVHSGRDDLGRAFEDELPAAEFVQETDEGEDRYIVDLVESLRQNRPETMVKWGIAVEAWEQARRRGDVSQLRPGLASTRSAGD